MRRPQRAGHFPEVRAHADYISALSRAHQAVLRVQDDDRLHLNLQMLHHQAKETPR